jgi:hypothetical protein
MYNKYGNKFMCFSPPVMLATFLIEFVLLFYVLWRYKMNTLTRLAAIFLGSLGIFQLSEYMLCGGLGLGHIEWVKIGFVAITLLPALGLHMTAILAGAKVKPLIYSAYASMALFIGYFVFATGTSVIRECAPNYAIFEVGGILSWIYVLYYYGWLLLTVGLAAYWARKTPAKASVLRWMAAGYAVFIVPTTVANLIDPATIHAIPSIMCGFAVLCAIILVWQVLPLSKTPLRVTTSTVKKSS